MNVMVCNGSLSLVTYFLLLIVFYHLTSPVLLYCIASIVAASADDRRELLSLSLSNSFGGIDTITVNGRFDVNSLTMVNGGNDDDLIDVHHIRDVIISGDNSDIISSMVGLAIGRVTIQSDGSNINNMDGNDIITASSSPLTTTPASTCLFPRTIIVVGGNGDDAITTSYATRSLTIGDYASLRVSAMDMVHSFEFIDDHNAPFVDGNGFDTLKVSTLPYGSVYTHGGGGGDNITMDCNHCFIISVGDTSYGMLA
jgi:hypothetical protein